MKHHNEYSIAFPGFDSTPKTVIAAIAFSLAMRLCCDNWKDAQEMIRDEWDALHPYIVPQKPKVDR